MLGSAGMALYGLGLGTLFFLVGAFAINLPKAGAWMMGIKWVAGLVLAYLALAYVRDTLPKGLLQGLGGAGGWLTVTGGALFAIGGTLAAVHVAAERRRSPLARLSKPAKLASILPAVAGLFLVVSRWQLGAPELGWESSEPAAVARAAAEHRGLLVDFGATWCASCRELERETFPDPRVRAQGSRFVGLHVDATNEDDPEVTRVRQKYGATEGLPVVLLFGTDGREAYRFTEFVTPDCFAAALAKVR